MINADLARSCAIVGIGETAIGKLPDRTTNDLAFEAIRAAVSNAGLRLQDVDGLIAAQPSRMPQRSFALNLTRGLGLDPRYVADVTIGGASAVASVGQAAVAIRAKLCRTVVCVYSGKQATGADEPRSGHLSDALEDFEEPWGLHGAIPHHAAVAARHMFEFGTTSEQLAAVAVACRKHASLNPRAAMRKPLTVEDVVSSRWIVEPLHLLDCCLVSDGAGAVVVTSVDLARGTPKVPVLVEGFGVGFAPGPLEMPSLTTLASRTAAQAAYTMSGLEPKDVDFAELYDSFTIIPLVTLEDYGFCAKGEGGEFVRHGRIEIGGALPINTHGGLLSHGHAEGMHHLTEAVKQLRGNEVEPERQVSGAQVGIVSGNGATLSAHATLLLSRDTSQ